ncbi:MAG: hypothetical protein Q8P56_05225 [Candidatus Uhrbacteria bacterium]|nr:hypothetical protein [Candidatus Uhrbacteria bacterium]
MRVFEGCFVDKLQLDYNKTGAVFCQGFLCPQDIHRHIFNKITKNTVFYHYYKANHSRPHEHVVLYQNESIINRGMFYFLKILSVVILLCAGFAPNPSGAVSIFNISDKMSSQKIGTPSDHLITFRSTSGVVAGAITLDFSSVSDSMGLIFGVISVVTVLILSKIPVIFT